MKVLTFICIGCLFLIALCVIYTHWETKNFIESLPIPPVAESGITINTQQTSSEEGQNSESQLEVSTHDGLFPETPYEERIESQQSIDNEQNDGAYPDEDPPEIKSWDDMIAIAEQEARARGTWIGDPETMDPDELRNAVYNQLLERFGDIPEVHTYIEYSRKWDRDLPITLDEEIEGLEATNYLFPHPSTQRTIDYNKWLRNRAGPSGDLQDITPTDIAELRSIGISVVTEFTEDGDYRITISTE